MAASSLKSLYAVSITERNMLDDTAPVRIHSGDPIDHQIANCRIENERLQVILKERQYLFPTALSVHGLAAGWKVEPSGV